MINRFDGEYRFLSNFWTVPIEFEGLSFPSVEHAFVAAKTLDQNERVHIAHIGTAREVKAYGRKLKLRPDWEEVKVSVMTQLVTQKFTNYSGLKRRLLETGDQELIEGNWWGDKFWGVDLKTGIGQNKLGKILMDVREELSAQLTELNS